MVSLVATAGLYRKISLGVYLFHVLVHVLLGPWLDQLGIATDTQNVLRVWLLAALSVGAAAAPWYFLEKPLSRLKPAPAGRRKA